MLGAIAHSKNLYWVGGTGNWTNPSHWAAKSGGTGGAGVPTAKDHVFFDQLSSGASYTVMIAGQQECKSIHVQQSAKVLFMGQSTALLDVYGDFVLAPSTSFSFGGTLRFKNAQTAVIQTNGAVITGDVEFSGAGEYMLQSDLIQTETSRLTFRSGVLTTNGHRIRTGWFRSSGPGFKKMICGTSAFYIEKGWKLEGNLDFDGLQAEVNLNPSIPETEIIRGPGSGATYRTLFSCVNPVNTNDTLYIELVVSSDYSGEDISCNGACDGEITITASSTQGGPFSYSFQGGAPASQTVFPGLCVGNYSVTVIDSSQILFFNPNPVYFQCTRDIDINEPSIISLDNEFAINPPSCPDSCDGAYLVTAAGGAGGYTYNWSNGDVGASSNNLCTGWNNITITDANGCSFQDSINIIDPQPIFANVTANGVSCFGVCDGYLVSNPTGGNGAPYTWSWSTGSTADSIGGLCAATYSLTLFDSNNCPSDTTGLQVTTPLQILVSVIDHVDNLCFSDCDGVLEVSVVQGTSPYSFQWKDVAGNPLPGETNSVISGLCAGDYYCVVTDANGCQDSSALETITQPPLIVPTLSNINDALCFGDCNGTATVSAIGGVGGYSYQWIDATGGGSVGAGSSINTLCAGDYVAQVTDANGCAVQSNVFTIDAPQLLDATISDVDVLCNGQCTGSATIVVTGGAPGYSIQWFSTPSNPIPGATGLTVNNRCDGSYFAEITDANGCVIASPITDITEPSGLTLNTTVSDILCNGDCNGSIEAIVGGGTPFSTGDYVYQWYTCSPTTSLPGQTSSVIDGLCPDIYAVEITDSNGCTISNIGSCILIDDPAVLDVTIVSTTNASCGGFCDGTATSSFSGGTGAVTVEWFDATTDISVGNGANINTLCTGNYYAVATDANGCQDTTNVFVITDNVLVTGTLSTNDATCFGFCDGSGQVVAAGGTAPYTYDWVDLSSGTTVSVADVANGLCAGNYTVQVIDVNLCASAPIPFNINESPQLSGALSNTDASCGGDCDGSASILVSGGVPGYTYTWTPAPPFGQGTANVTQLCAGTYVINVTDNIGCFFDSTVVITEPSTFDLTISFSPETCDGFNDGSASVIVNSGGTGPYTFSWNPIPGVDNGDGTASSMLPGSYNLTITDAALCDTAVTVVIDAASPLTVDASVIAQNQCHGDCNGIANALALGGTGVYNYAWIPAPPIGQGTSTASGLCVGNYQIQVSDGNGCVANDNVTITQPNAFDVSSSAVDPACNGVCDGEATVTVNSGGTPPYLYQWNDPLSQNTATAFNLCAGTYQCTVTDLNGCDTVITAVIGEPTLLDVTLSSTNTTCFGTCVGDAQVAILGGTPPYNVEWFNSSTGVLVGTGSSINSLCTGTFFGVVTDAAGCTFNTGDFNILENPVIDISLAVTESNCVNCIGTATATATGGSGVYVDYQWSPAPGAGQGTPSATALCSGVYGLTVTDTDGCTGNVPVAVSDAPTEVFTLDSTDASCFGSCDGIATIMLTCSDPPCTFEWYNDLGVTIGQTTQTATGLCAGEYAVEVTNNSGCLTIGTIAVNDGEAIDVISAFADPVCNGDCNGEAEVIVSGGLGGFTYVWSPAPLGGQGTNTAAGLCAGNWDVQITDANGCDTLINFTLTDPSVLDVSNVVSNDVSCAGFNDGSATVFPSGGAGSYSYIWFDCVTDLPIGQTGQSATGLAPGSYFVEVTDAVSCGQTSICVVIDEPLSLSGVLSFTNANCNGICDGTATVVPSGGNNNYTQQWYSLLIGLIPGATGTTTTNLCPGDYEVEVTDLNGCSVTLGPVTISQPDAFDLSVSTTDVSCNGGNDGSASIAVNAGGTPAYTFTWLPAPSGGQGTPNATGLSAGAYTVTLEDANLCDTSFVVVIAEPALFDFGLTVTPVTCNGDFNGAIQTNLTGGTGPYLYNWLPGGETTSDLNSLGAGTYTVNIQDASGCLASETITLMDPPVLSATAVSNNTTCGNCDGNATVNIAGGYGVPYTISWSPVPGGGQGTATATGLCAGLYTVTVTDPGGCVETASATVSDIGAETVAMSSTDASCFDVCDGSATATFVCGDPACSVAWFDASTGAPIGQTSSTANGLCEGNYAVEVINNSGCSTVMPVAVGAPSELLATETIVNPACGGGNDGSISVLTSGGSGGGYTYVWSPAPGGGQGTPNAIGLSAGIWQLTLTDGAGCDSVYTFILNDPSAISATLLSTDVLCNGDADGEITVTPLGGAFPYTYQWLDASLNPIPGEISTTISGIGSGDYSVVVTDQNGCSITEGPLTIGEPAALSISISVTDVLCNGDCNGTGTAAVSGGTAPVVVNWFFVSTGLSAGVTGLNVNGLCPDDYFAIASDANGCTAISGNATVSEPLLLTAVASGTDASCFGDCDGTGVSNPAGGEGPYNYNWLDGTGNPVAGGTSQNVSNLCADLYEVTVTDANGCTTAPLTVLVQEPTQITGTIFINDASCALPDGSASIVAAGGAGGFTYQWLDDIFVPLAGETSQTLSGVPAGTYYVNVTDFSGCTEQFQATIGNLNAPTVVIDAITDASCQGAADGSIQITVTALSNPYTTLWNPGGLVAEDPTGMVAGTYTLTVTDALGCIALASAVINEPSQLTASFNTTDASCGVCDGSGTATVTGGTAPYSVLWSNGDNGLTAQNLCVGGYTAQITDANGCVVSLNANIGSDGGPTGQLISVTSPTCAGSCDGTATVAATGGTAPYTYFWVGIGSGGPTQNGLCAGTYLVQAADATGCVSDINFTIFDPPSLSVTDNINPNTCGMCDGEVGLSVSGGVPPYIYNWSTGGATSTETGLCSGVYIVDISDGTGCTQTFTYLMNSASGPSATLAVTDELCTGSCDGQIDAVIGGGSAPYSTTWLDGMGLPIGQTAVPATGLCTGDYILQIEDGAGCSGFVSATVSSPDPLVFNVPVTNPTECAAGCTGSATALPVGGTLPYTFAWNPGGISGPTASGLCDGVYTIDVTDANGCAGSQTITIGTSLTLTASVTSNDATCGLCDGDATLTISGGAAPYSVLWSTGASGTSVTGLCAGIYTADITDANGCTQQVNITINNTGGPTGETINQTNVSCFGGFDGSVSITPTGGTAPYNYLWVPSGIPSNTLTNVSAGTYTLEISDANGCIRVVPVSITEPDQINANPVTTNPNCGQCNGAIVLLTSGGDGGPFTYSWTGGLPASDSQDGVCAGIYDVTITDGSGCSITQAVAISSTSGPQLSVIGTDPNCFGICDGNVEVIPTTGTGPFDYLWNTGDNTSNVSSLCGGTYTVQVTDQATGCVSTGQTNISDPNQLGLSLINVIDAGCSGVCDGVATAIASGGILPLVYQWSDPSAQSTPSATGLCQGIYNVQVTDANGCSASQATIIDSDPVITAVVASNNATCGLCDGDATVTPAGGVAPYTLTWSDGQSGTAANDLCAGVYTVQILGSNGCAEQVNVTINNTGGPTGETINQTDVSCFGLADGDVTVTPIGGTPPYTYLWVPSGNSTNTLNNLSAGTYALEVIDANNCIRVVPITINEPAEMTVNPLMINPDCGACNGSIQLFTAGGAGGYVYNWSGGLPSQANQNGLCAGMYNVTVTDANGCAQDFSIPLGSSQAPLVQTAFTNETCYNLCDGTADALVSGGSGNYTYAWSDGQISSSLAGLCGGQLSLVVTDVSTGCVGAGFVEITSADTLGLSVPNVIDASCNGVCDGEASAVISGGTLPLTYFWNDPATQSTSTATALCAGNYFVTVTDANGCVALQDMTITEPSPIVVVVDSVLDAKCLNSQDGEIYVTASGGSGGLTYSWITDPAGFTSTNEDLTGLDPMTYILEVIDISGCSVIDSILVDTLFVVLANAGPDQIACPGVPLTIIGTGTSTMPLTYTWYDDAGVALSNDSSLTVIEQPGTYTYVFEARDDSCFHTDTVIIIVNPSPIANAGQDIELVKGESAVIGGSPTSLAGSSIVWSPTTYFTTQDSSLSNPTVLPDSTTWYYVTVVDTNGCSATDSVYVYVFPDISFPNGFSPNGDGVNEVWEIDLITQFPENVVEIYNRWGELLFYSEGYTVPWDGRFNGKPLPVGTYYYVINLNHPLFPDAFTGPITILR